MKSRVIGLILLGLSIGVMATNVHKVSVSIDGSITLNGNKVTLSELAESFKTSGGEVWYYRESPESEPHPHASAVIRLVIEHKLPILLSTEPDFSRVVDEHGNERPRN